MRSLILNTCTPILALLLISLSCRHAPEGRRSVPEPNVSTSVPDDSLLDKGDKNPAPDQTQQTKTGGRGGVIDGNTGELITTEYNPWFIDHQAVPYCIELSDDFSLSKGDVEAAISRSIATWKNVLDGLTSFDANWTDIDLPRTTFPLKVSTDYRKVDCGTNPRLIFKLGTMDADIRATLAHTARHTIGFAKRTEYDVKTGQSRGYIWISPDLGDHRYVGMDAKKGFWTHEHRFFNVVSHEIGHILGMTHEKNTVMDQRLPAKVVSSPSKWRWSGSEYLWSHEFPGNFCGRIATADAGVMELLFGTNQKGNLELCTTYRPQTSATDSRYELDLTLKSDAQIIASRRVETKYFSGHRRSISAQFLKPSQENSSGYVSFDFAEYFLSAAFKGVLVTEAKKIPIAIERDYPLVFAIRIVHDSEWKLLVWQHATGIDNLNELMTLIESP